MYSEIWQPDGQTSTDPIVTYIDLQLDEHNEVCDALTTLLVDLFALYVKTKVFHWHASGLGSRGRHLLLAEQADQVLVTIDTIGERVRALGGTSARLVACTGLATAPRRTRPRARCWRRCCATPG